MGLENWNGGDSAYAINERMMEKYSPDFEKRWHEADKEFFDYCEKAAKDALGEISDKDVSILAKDSTTEKGRSYVWSIANYVTPDTWDLMDIAFTEQAEEEYRAAKNKKKK